MSMGPDFEQLAGRAPTPETLALIHDEVVKAIDLQFDRYDVITLRAQQVLTFAASSWACSWACGRRASLAVARRYCLGQPWQHSPRWC